MAQADLAAPRATVETSAPNGGQLHPLKAVCIIGEVEVYAPLIAVIA
jgi:hypothetical protein